MENKNFNTGIYQIVNKEKVKNVIGGVKEMG